MEAEMKLRERLRLRRLDLIERDGGAPERLAERLGKGDPLPEVASELEALLARPSSSVGGVLRAARRVRDELSEGLSPEDEAGLEEVMTRVEKLEVGPSRLKIDLYNHAHRLGRRELLEEHWFQELLDRSETRSLLDTTEAG